MGTINLMILMSRFVFVGFGSVFIIIAFSFMRPFISYSIGENKQRYKLMYRCIICLHLGATSILIGQARDWGSIQGVIINSLIYIGVITVGRLILKLCYREEVLILWYMIFFLLDISYIMLQRLNHSLASRQVIWMGIGLVAALFIPHIIQRLIHQKYRVLYGVLTVGLILSPFVIGTSRNGALNWIKIGEISFQPSEIAKVVFVMFLGASLSMFDPKKSQKKLVASTMTVLLIILVALVLQRDLGSAMLYFITFIVMAYVGTSVIWIPIIGVVGSLVGVVVGYVLFSHVRIRVDIWIDPFADLLGTGYQVVQGLFALGTWGFWGSGLTKGMPTVIPIVETDYIFAAIGEEFGNAFGIIVLLCYLGLILQGLKVAMVQKKSFYALIAIGITVLLGVQTLIIVCGVLKLIPLTGITMPFVSYGGSSMLVSFGMMGLLSYLLSSAIKKSKKESEEFEV